MGYITWRGYKLKVLNLAHSIVIHGAVLRLGAPAWAGACVCACLSDSVQTGAMMSWRVFSRGRARVPPTSWLSRTCLSRDHSAVAARQSTVSLTSFWHHFNWTLARHLRPRATSAHIAVKDERNILSIRSLWICPRVRIVTHTMRFINAQIAARTQERYK